jgi:hypothetical protein
VATNVAPIYPRPRGGRPRCVELIEGFVVAKFDEFFVFVQRHLVTPSFGRHLLQWRRAGKSKSLFPRGNHWFIRPVLATLLVHPPRMKRPRRKPEPTERYSPKPETLMTFLAFQLRFPYVSVSTDGTVNWLGGAAGTGAALFVFL